jgi:hypothetical protein
MKETWLVSSMVRHYCILAKPYQARELEMEVCFNEMASIKKWGNLFSDLISNHVIDNLEHKQMFINDLS